MSHTSIAQATQAAPAKAAVAARTRLLLEGPIVSTLLRLAAPNVLVNVILIAVTTTVDAHFIGRLGSNALAGIALVFPFIMMMQQMANSSMGGAIASAIARAIGAGRHSDASALVVHGLIVAAGMAAIFTALLLVGGPAMYGIIGGSGEILDTALAYSDALFAGAIIYWVLSTLTSVVRGAGHAAVLAVVYVAAEALHIVLVPMLMFGIGPLPAFGIAGAGMATIASFATSSAVLAWYVVSGRTAIRMSFRDVRPSRRLFVEILRVGAPMSLQPVLANLSLAIVTGFVTALGTAHLAAFGIAARLEYLLYPLAFGLGAGVLALVGTNLGAGQPERAVRATWIATALGALITGCIGLFGVGAADVWAGLFTDSADLQALAAAFLAIIGLTYPLVGAGVVVGSAFQAAGRPLWPLLAVAGRVIAVTVAGWFMIQLGAGLTGIAFAAAIGVIIYGTTLVIAFRAGLWRAPARASEGKQG